MLVPTLSAISVDSGRLTIKTMQFPLSVKGVVISGTDVATTEGFGSLIAIDIFIVPQKIHPLSIPEIKTPWYHRGMEYLYAEVPPTVETARGRKEWRLGDVLHREDGPALILPNGDQGWYWHGKLHRGYDYPAMITVVDIRWFAEGQRHRVCGPSVWQELIRFSRWCLEDTRYF